MKRRGNGRSSVSHRAERVCVGGMCACVRVCACVRGPSLLVGAQVEKPAAQLCGLIVVVGGVAFVAAVVC